MNKILGELKTNEALKSNDLVKMLVESTDKSIKLGENLDQVYEKLKGGIQSIAIATKNPVLEAMSEQLYKNDESTDSKLFKLAQEVNLLSKIQKIKESSIYSNALVKGKVDSFESILNKGSLEFMLCEGFIRTFDQYSYDKDVKQTLDETKKYLVENQSTIAMLNTIVNLQAMNSPIYAGIISDLKDMVISENYTADILKVKYGNTIPAISGLINDLLIIESKKTGNFTIGVGNSETRINNLITPAIQTEDGLLAYVDNRFLSIREASGLLGNETKVHIDESFKISEVSPEFVKNKYGLFYNLCESFVTLGFTKTLDGLGVESNNIRRTKLGIKINEESSLDLYVNSTKMDSPEITNLHEALSLETPSTQSRVNILIENFKNICNFEFIKEVSNDRLLKESLVLNLNESYFICDKVNSADRVWKKVDEYELYEFFKSNFNYDISPIFKTKIDTRVKQLNELEERKTTILDNITKIEEKISTINSTISSGSIDRSEVHKLESIKEALEQTVNRLKNDFIEIDLIKKKELVK